MRNAAFYSALFHGLVFLILSLGLPNPFERKLADQRPLLIEFETIAPVSMAPVLAPESAVTPDPESEPKVEEKKDDQPQPPEPSQVSPASPPAEPEPEVTADDNAPSPDSEPVEPTPEDPVEIEEAIPQDQIPETKKKPQLIEKPKKKPKPPKKKIEISLDKKEEKQKSDSKEKKKIDDDFAELLDSVKKEDKKEKQKKVKSGLKGAPADQIGPVMTGTEIDAVRRTIAKCWIVPNGARGAKDLIVEIDMKIEKDGTVTKAVVTDTKRYQSDSAFRSAADSARRAVLNPNCNPLPLSAEKYEQWKNLTMSFNPKDMY